MERATQIARLVLLCAGILLLVFLSILAWTAMRTIVDLSNHVDGVLTRFEAIETKINATAINMDEATRTWEKASEDQSIMLASLTNNVNGVVDKAGDAITSIKSNSDNLNTELDALTKATQQTTALGNALTVDAQSVQASLGKLPPLIDAYTRTGNDLDKRLSDPNLAAFEYHLAGMSISWDKTSSDFETRFHAILYPPPCHGFGCVTTKLWPIIKETPAFGQGAYWTEQLIRNTKPN